MPRIVAVRSSDTYKGDDWIGLKMRDASVVRGIGVLPVFAGLIGLLLLVGASPPPGRAKAADAAFDGARRRRRHSPRIRSR